MSYFEGLFESAEEALRRGLLTGSWLVERELFYGG